MTQGNKLVQWLVRWTEVLNRFFTIYFRTCFHSLKNRVRARVTELDHPVWFGFDNLLFMFDFVVILTFYISKFSFLSFMFDLVFYLTPLGLKISFWPSLSLSLSLTYSFLVAQFSTLKPSKIRVYLKLCLVTLLDHKWTELSLLIILWEMLCL